MKIREKEKEKQNKTLVRSRHEAKAVSEVLGGSDSPMESW